MNVSILSSMARYRNPIYLYKLGKSVSIDSVDRVPIDSERYRECPEQKKIEKAGEKNSCYRREQGVI